MQEQFVRFLGRGLAVVAGDGDRHLGRYERALEALHLGEHGLDHVHRVGPGPLGHGQGDRRLRVALTTAGAEQHVGLRLLRAVGETGDLVQVDRTPLVHADHDAAGLGCRGEEGAGLHGDLRVPAAQHAGVRLLVGGAQPLGQVRRAQVAGSERQRVELHPQLPPGATDEPGLGHLEDGLDGVVHLGGQAAQGEVVVGFRVEGEGEDGHVVDAVRLDERPRDAVGDAVEVGLQLLVEADDGLLEVRAHVEAGDEQTLPGGGGGVDVFHPGQFVEQLLHGHGQPLLDFLRGGAGHGDDDVDHRHLDLRLLLARVEAGEDLDQAVTALAGAHQAQPGRVPLDDEHPVHLSSRDHRGLGHEQGNGRCTGDTHAGELSAAQVRPRRQVQGDRGGARARVGRRADLGNRGCRLDPGRGDMDGEPVTEADTRDEAFGQGGADLQAAVVLQFEQHRAGRGQGAGVDPLGGDHACKGRGDGGVGEHGPRLLVGGLGDGELVGHGPDRVRGGGVPGEQTAVALEVTFCLGQLGLGLPEPGGDLTGLEGDQHLARSHRRAEGHIHATDHAAHLGADGGPLRRLHGAGQLDQGGNFARLDAGHRHHHRLTGRGGRGGDRDRQQQAQGEEGGQEQGGQQTNRVGGRCHGVSFPR